MSQPNLPLDEQTKQLRELDAFIAEHVFGWKWFAFKPVTPNTRRWTVLLEPAAWQKRKGGKVVFAPHKDDERDIGSIEHYTTDPAAAMMVLERCAVKLAERFVTMSRYGLVIFSPRGPIRHWTIRDEDKDIVANGETLPLAICKFSKQLFGGKP